MYLPRTATLFVVSALVSISALPVVAQPATGSITGVVRDTTGAPVPAVTITITNREAETIREVSSETDGTYEAGGLLPGLYTISVELTGFARTTRDEVRVVANEATTVDFTLEPRLEEMLTVTGTRVRGRTATETPAPVDVLDATAIRSTGAAETGKILQLLAPSVNFSTTFISDGTDIVRPATLRGLGPDQTLLLVNGKRRHQTALIHIQQTIARGDRRLRHQYDSGLGHRARGGAP